MFQTGITNVRSQVTAISPWVIGNVGKKVTMIIPDYIFGYNHRDFFTEAAKKQGGAVNAVIAIPPTETSFTKYFSQIPAGTDAIYHVMVGPGVLTFVRELGVKVTCLHEGTVLAEGTIDQVSSNERVIEVYLGR